MCWGGVINLIPKVLSNLGMAIIFLCHYSTRSINKLQPALRTYFHPLDQKYTPRPSALVPRPISNKSVKMDEQLLHGHNGEVHCVALRSNGHVASGSESGSIIVHSTSSNKVEYQADNVFTGGVSGLCYLPNDSGLVACGYDGSGGGNLKVLSPSLELKQTLVGHDGYVECVTVSPSGSHIASCDVYGKVMIWSEPGEGDEWARVQVLEDHTSTIRAVCFSPDGKQLATGSGDQSINPNQINLYSFNEGNAILAHTLEGHTNEVSSLSFSPDCKLLCSGSGDRSIKFWNPADGSLVKSIDQAHTTSYVRSVSYSPNGRVVASGADDKSIKIWDASTFELKHTFDALHTFGVEDLSFTPDSNFLVSGSYDNTVRLTNVAFPTTASNLLEGLKGEDPIMVKEAILTLIKLDKLFLLSAALALVRERRFSEATMLLRAVWKLMREVSERL